jgi:hypothetical protein
MFAPRSRAPSLAEMFRGLAMTPEQRERLCVAASDLQEAMRSKQGRSINCSVKERLRMRLRAQTAVNHLLEAFESPFAYDLTIDSSGPPDEDLKVLQARDLLRLLKKRIDGMTEAGLRKRWAGRDGRTDRASITSFETDLARQAVRQAGFCADPPDLLGLAVLRCFLSFTGGKVLSESAVRKRMAADDNRRAGQAALVPRIERLLAALKRFAVDDNRRAEQAALVRGLELVLAEVSGKL